MSTTTPSCRIIVKNLSKNVSAEDLKKAVSGTVVVTDAKIATTPEGVSRRFGFLGFRTPEDASKAIALLNNTYVKTSKVVAEFAIPVGEGEKKSNGKKNQTEGSVPSSVSRPLSLLSPADEELLHDTGRIHVVNLPHSATREEIEEFFKSQFGPVREAHLVVDEDSGRPRGIAFITFVFPQAAIAAAKSPPMSVLFQGRILRISPAKEEKRAEDISKTTNSKLTDFQKKRLEKKIETSTTAVHTWNLLYMSANSAVASIVANTDKSITRSSILVGESAKDDAAVKTAIAETEVITQTKDWLIAQGINPSAFTRTGTSLLNATSSETKRSTTTIIVKHLPIDVDAESLRFYFTRNNETLVRFLLAPSKTVALVQFADEGSAKRSFKANAFRKYKCVPLYLEWAPESVFDPVGDSQQDQTNGTDDLINNTTEALDEQESTAISTPSSKSTPSSINLSSPTLQTTSSRLCVRNVAFEATAKDIRKLFAAYARVVAVRLPVKMASAGDASSGLRQQHRGFAFVEFASNAEMVKAMDALHNTHLYGRKLVLEVAAMEDGSVDAARKKAMRRDDVTASINASESKRRRVEETLGDDDNAFEDLFTMD